MTKQAHKRNSREAVWRAVAGVLGVLLLIWALLPLLRHILNVGVAALGAAGLLLLGGAIWFGEVKRLFAYIWEKGGCGSCCWWCAAWWWRCWRCSSRYPASCSMRRRKKRRKTPR